MNTIHSDMHEKENTIGLNTPGIKPHRIMGNTHILPWVSIGIVVISIVFVNLNRKHWEDPNRVMVYDVASYYAYLPALFIHNDLSFDFIKNNEDFHIKRYRLYLRPGRKPVIQTTMGLAVLYTPFFWMAHLLASPLGYEPDGYSIPYRVALIFSSLFYLIIGLLFLRKILLRYFSSGLTALTIILVVTGTNLLHYATQEGPMPHSYNFTLIAVFLYLVIRWYENPSIRITILTGFIAGFITLIRPTNILILLLLVLWDVKSRKHIVERFFFLLKHYKLILLMAVFFFLVWLPQLIYWHYTTGFFFYYSYGPYNEGFFFNNPQVINQLFSYRKGWFVYTPVMFMSFIGIFFLLRSSRNGFFIPIVIYMSATVYILSSWWNWWFGGGFGLRSYIDTYAVMAVPLAAIIEKGIHGKKGFRMATSVIIILLTGLNLFQTWHYHKGFIHYDGMNKKTYWAMFGRTRLHPDFWNLVEKPDHKMALRGIYIAKLKLPQPRLTEENCVEEMIKIISETPGWLKLIEEKAIARGIALETMIRLDAGWQCAKLKEKGQLALNEFSDEDCIDQIISQILQDEAWLETVKEKARKKKIPLDQMIRKDAEWLCR
jgi:hypothetical protein